MIDDAPIVDAGRARVILTRVGVFVVLTLLLVRERSGEVGLWDWDTYGRFHFIHDYHPDRWVDGHLLYHGVMRLLMALGLRDTKAVVLETALGAAAFLYLFYWICQREKLSRAATRTVIAAATIGSPGLVALFLMAEDNVLYFPIVLGAFYLLYQQHPDRRTAVRRGVLLGVVLAAAILINVSLLVMMFALPAGLVIWLWQRDRIRALGLAVAGAIAIIVHYAAHVFPFTGARVALHEFLPKALGLEDFAQSTSPLLSLERFRLYRGGLRAIALTPNLHLMSLPPGLHTLVVTILPALVGICVASLAIWLVRFRRAALVLAVRTRLDLLALVAISLAFPYFYEPVMIERWDVFWIGALFALVPFWKLAPSRVAVGLVVSILALQSVATIITVAHHYGVAWSDPRLVDARATARQVVDQNRTPVVLPFTIDRLILADFVFRTMGRPIYLVREGVAVDCFRLMNLDEVPVPLDEVKQAVGARSAYVDAALSTQARAALGLHP